MRWNKRGNFNFAAWILENFCVDYSTITRHTNIVFFIEYSRKNFDKF